MPKKPINVRLDDELVAAVDALAAALDTDRTDLIARSLRRELLYDGKREFIYVLRDGGGVVRYVGRARNPHARLRDHIAGARAGGSSAKEAWLASMLANDQLPVMSIIDDAEAGPDIRELEAQWITKLRDGGALTNGRVAADVVPTARGAIAGRRHSVYLPEGLWEQIEPEALMIDRSVSWWFATAATEKLEREGRPEPPPVVKQYDENAKGRTR